jgi:hypothetical protein
LAENELSLLFFTFLNRSITFSSYFSIKSDRLNTISYSVSHLLYYL